MSARAAGAALALVLATPGCRQGEKTVAFDLARRAPAADVQSPWDLLLLGTPAAEARQEQGFFKEPTAPLGDSSAAMALEAEVSLRWPEPAPRILVLDAAPLSGSPARALKVALNDTEVGRVALVEGRRRYRVDLPVESQKARLNRLRFALETGSAGSGDRSTRFYALALGSPKDAVLTGFLEEGAPPALSVGAESGVPTVVQAASTILRFALQAPGGAELRFRPDLHAHTRAAGAAASFKITLKEAPVAEDREIWKLDLGPGDRSPGEVRVPLPLPFGKPFRLSLHVSGGRSAWGVWSAPRVLGVALSEPLRPVPKDQDDARRRRADTLRSALAGSNVVFVILDAAGAKHFGCYGYSRRTTPEIDRLAAEGITFEKAYTPAVFTRAAMAAVWTSRYPDQHHSEVVRDTLRLPEDRLTLAELLAAQGVHTAGFVANPNAGENAGLGRGFAEFHGVYAQPGRPGGAVRADAFRERLLPWIESRRSGRFFAYLHFREPHFPYDPAPPFDTLFGPDSPLPREAREEKSWTIRVSLGKEKATPEQLAHLVRLYDGNLAAADHEIGLLRRALERAGLWEHTAVIVTADHGEELSEHGFIGHNEQLFEETMRIPLVMRLPRGAGLEGVRSAELVDLVDVAPTVADIFGVLGKGGSDRSFQGQSLLPVAAGGPGKPATVSRTIMKHPAYALSDGRFKFIEDLRRGSQELYDLSRDPKEQDDVAQRDPLRAAFYRQTLARWILDLGPAGALAAPGRAPSPEELEQLKALGYVN